jgi:predicted nucleic acid-binding protein
VVIVDTTVLVDYFQGVRNAETDWLDVALEHQRLGLTDIIFCEVLQGVRDDVAAKAVERELAKLVVFETGGVALARDAARNYASFGVVVIRCERTIDWLIATFCLRDVA